MSIASQSIKVIIGVSEKFSKKLKLGRISIPLPQISFDNFICSLLGLEHKYVPGENRIIHDLSFPKDLSVNSSFPTCNSTVQYESRGNFIQLKKQFSPYSLIAKIVIKIWFRNIPIHPSDYNILGFYGKVTVKFLKLSVLVYTE